MNSTAQPNKKRGWLGRAAKALGVLILLLIGAGLVAQRLSDGPLNDIIPGGPLRAGALVSEADIDWAAVLDDAGGIAIVELQLVEPASSRWVGVMEHDGQLYVPCDLGFMWGRFSGSQRRVLHLIYIFKRWHEDAQRDGRAVLRIDGKRYQRQAVRVTDPELLAALRLQLEGMARQMVAPDPLADAPTEGPRDIWFFRMDPRAASR